MQTRNLGSHASDSSERNPRFQELPRNLQRKVYSRSTHKHYSDLTVSLDCSSFGWGMQRIPASFRGIFSSWGRKETLVSDVGRGRLKSGKLEKLEGRENKVDQSLKRCSWITKSSDDVYVSFHDKCWGVPIFYESGLFELLTLSGMLIDYNWTKILKRKELYRKVFVKFDYNAVAKMDEKDVVEISSKKNLGLAESRIRCILNNAKCIQQVAAEFGSFSGYIWSHVNHRPIINKHRNSRRFIPLKTPKSEAISKDLVSRGFRLVSPVTIYSFMQVAGMAIDHDIECFRFSECVKVAERSWGMTNLGM